MIDVEAVLRDIPHSETFCSVGKLHAMVESLRSDDRFVIEVCGTSVNGQPIHHVQFGKGTIKALIVASPHCMEPIGSLTVFSLLTLLHGGHSGLLSAAVEWHIVPCIDPDGALLNEGWSQERFAPEKFLRHFYMQPWCDQVDTSIPVTYKNLAITTPPSREASVLMALLDRVRPDFFFSLHNTFAGGAFYLFSRDMGTRCYEGIHQLLGRLHVPIRKEPQWSEFLKQYSTGIVEMYSVRKHYDFLERTMPRPEEVFELGVGSFEYLAGIKPESLAFMAEVGYFQHPFNGSAKETGENLRKFKLEVEAGSKFIATVILKEWDQVKNDVDRGSPFYRAMVGYVLPTEKKLWEGGMPISRYPSRDALFNPAYDRPMTEGDKFDICIVNDGLKLLAIYYQFLRLLEASPKTAAVRAARERLERVLGEAFQDIQRECDLSKIQVFDCDTLTRVQLGSGLIALNAVLQESTR